MPNYNLNEENIKSDDLNKTIFYYVDQNGREVFKTKEIYKKEAKIIVYPYSVNRATGQVNPKKIKAIEFIGWNSINNIPNDFKQNKGYGFSSQRLKYFMSFIYPKAKDLERIVVKLNGKNRFGDKSYYFNWSDLEGVLKNISKEQGSFDKYRKLAINNSLVKLSSKFSKIGNHLSSGELENFVNKFDSFEKISKNDIDAISKVFKGIPPSKILTTSHFIQTKEQIDKIYFEDIIAKFELLLKVQADNESDWQKFFEKNSWVLNHLFPYQIILYESQALVGGKTIKNEGGRIVDFLFNNGFNDNYALLEIKTHNKEIIKKTIYRAPDVYAITDELSGGINQCLDQKDIFLRDNGQKHQALDPKCILIIGQKSKLTKSQSKCFELFRANQKNIDIVTFDELLEKFSLKRSGGYQQIALHQ
jgi:hypothetical protein